jgi:serine/threonine protein kinase
MGAKQSGAVKNTARRDSNAKKQAEQEPNETMHQKLLRSIAFKRHQAMLERSDKFSDHYKVGNSIGKGTFGQVRICRHMLSRKLMAVRILKKKLLTEDLLNRYMTEALLQGMMKHPNTLHF